MKRILILITLLALIPAAAPRAHAAGANNYQWTILTADSTSSSFPAANIDADLIDGWGLAFFPGEPFTVADRGTGLSSTYDGLGTVLGALVAIPLPLNDENGHSSPTGMVANSTSTAFLIPGTGLPAQFLVATQDGTICGWNAGVTVATQFVDNSQGAGGNPAGGGAVYYGLATGNTTAGLYLYAPNFRTGKIDVFNTSFTPVTLPGTFTDPSLPAGFAPFNIVNVRGDLFITYAQQDSNKFLFVPGKKAGYVSVFDTNGNFIQRFASKGKLNAPWGIVETPYNFGSLSSVILVGNLGDGAINAFTLTGKAKGQMKDAVTHKPVAIDGLWSLAFGSGQGADPTTLYFTAGPMTGTHGEFGQIKAIAPSTPVVGPY